MKLIQTMGILAILALLFILIIYSALSWGYVGHTMYLWFIHPHFPDLPTFSVIHFIGFMLFANIMFNRSSGNYIKDEFKDKNTMYASMILSPWITLSVSWLIKSLLMWWNDLSTKSFPLTASQSNLTYYTIVVWRRLMKRSTSSKKDINSKGFIPPQILVEFLWMIWKIIVPL